MGHSGNCSSRPAVAVQYLESLSSAGPAPHALQFGTQVPVLPGSGLLSSEEEAGTLADGIGYPVLLKVRHALEFVPACCYAMKR